MFATCECVQRFTDSFGDLNDEIGQLHWYLYPVKIQKLLIPITMNAQKPVVVAFFGSISCSREQFKKVSQFCFPCSFLKFQVEDLLRNSNISIVNIGNKCWIFIFYGTS